jgi:hypothetical protein
MAPSYRVERDRGSKEFPQQLAVLRERWPLAFPTKHEDVRPLAMGAARQVAAGKARRRVPRRQSSSHKSAFCSSSAGC